MESAAAAAMDGDLLSLRDENTSLKKASHSLQSELKRFVRSLFTRSEVYREFTSSNRFRFFDMCSSQVFRDHCTVLTVYTFFGQYVWVGG